MQKYIELLDNTKLKLLYQFIENGLLTEYKDLHNILEKTRKKLVHLKDYNVTDLINELSKEYVEQTRSFVEISATPGISAGIKTHNGPEINVYYGKTSGLEDALPIDEKVRFDGASITKMYTAIQYVLKEFYGAYSLDDPIFKINPTFQQKTTLKELLTFYHIFHTNGKLEQICSTEEEAIQLLQNAKIVESGTYLYSDIPYMIASLIDPNFKDSFQEIFINEFGLTQTSYEVNPNDIITGGAMMELRQVHDPKARILSYAGHAGIYSTTHDSIQLFDEIMKTKIPLYLSQNLATPKFKKGYVTKPNGTMCTQQVTQTINGEKIIRKEPIWVNKAMGIYCKRPLGLDKTDVLPYQSRYAFAADGFTGVWLNYDFANQITANIFTNPLSGSIDGRKPKDYIYTLDHLKEKSLETVIALQYAQQVFEIYYGKSEDYQKRYIR